MRGWRPISAALHSPRSLLLCSGAGRLPFHHQARRPKYNRVSIGKTTKVVNTIPLWKSACKAFRALDILASSESRTPSRVRSNVNSIRRQDAAFRLLAKRCHASQHRGAIGVLIWKCSPNLHITNRLEHAHASRVGTGTSSTDILPHQARPVRPPCDGWKLLNRLTIGALPLPATNLNFRASLPVSEHE